MSADLDDKIDSIVAGIADEVTSYLRESIAPLVDELVRERLAGIVAQLGGTPPPVTRGAKAPKKGPRSVNAKPARVNKTAASVNKPGAKPVRRCSKCGTPGYRASGCGRTHNVKGKAKPAEADDEDEDEGSGPARSTFQGRAGQEARRPLPEKPALSPTPTEPTDDDDEPDDPTPFELAPAIAARPRCPHGADATRCSQCLGAVPTKVAIVGGAIVVDGQVVRTTREQELGAVPEYAKRVAQKNRLRAERRRAA